MQNLKYLLFIGCLFFFFTCNTKEEKKVSVTKIFNGYTITGVNYTDSDSIYLLNKDLNVINKAKIDNQNILLKGEINAPSVAFLKLNKEEDLHTIILENESFNVLFANNSATVLGGKLHQKYADYQNNIHQTAISKSKYVDDTYINENYLNFIEENSTNLLGLHLIQQKALSSKTIGEIQQRIESSTNTELKAYLTDLKANTIITEAAAKIENRPIAKGFSGTNLIGRITTLAQVKRGKKAVLIDFWASWCGPCRVLSPRIKKLYDTYKNQGFDIVTVSQDRSINAWENGVYEDAMENWNHVYDDDNDIAKMYGVRGIPHMVLLDDKGRIIQNKIPIDKLEKELKKIFK
ncbi:hypothetical protein LPB136_03465 [Tenacibaculum todarodis]|uniref:Thioredoxin domain-containing protein n=1 Tax=Tenacibaculum todarodis TaxID=1850252 RepID=A0A1L3JH80_9FLAO|nr:TlpA disulfide reductase family protein [Tenacibaculum todarodis]APG64477.1 hypothetical protein LPB136_03465 [Tenacibaculum todarodis]